MQDGQDKEYGVVTINMTDRRWLENLDAVVEFGVAIWPNNLTWQRLPPQRNHFCYLGEDEWIIAEYPGINQEEISEVALWQQLHDGIEVNNISISTNLSIDHNITDYYGTYTTQRSLNPDETNSIDRMLINMTAIGVQCKASSNVVRADINGVKSSFSNFQSTDTPISNRWTRCAPRFRSAVPWYMLSQHRNIIRELFETSPTAPPYVGAYDYGNSIDTVLLDHFYLQSDYLQAERLWQSLLRAYAAFAVQLMYNGGRAVTTLNGSQTTFINPNVTEFTSGLVIKPGLIPSIDPVGFFCLWALITSALNLVYGFRRRWTEILDGHTMFKMGAELSDQQRQELMKTSNVVKKEGSTVLDDIPALVGDTKHEMWPGRIGLVKSAKADKKKRYE